MRKGLGTNQGDFMASQLFIGKGIAKSLAFDCVFLVDIFRGLATPYVSILSYFLEVSKSVHQGPEDLGRHIC